MTHFEFAQAIASFWDIARPALRDELLRDIDTRIEGFRRAVYVGDVWCCAEMRGFAVDCWGAATPLTVESLGSIAYQLRGRTVNYCPFCGVAFQSPKRGQ